MSISIGQTAPDFKLFDSVKKETTLSQFKGKNVLLLFFPFAFTGTCTTELCAVRDDIASYNNANAEVLGISIDSLFTLAKFKDELKLNFTLLSDFNKEASTAYGSLYSEFVFGTKGVAKRSAFVIDKEGIVQYAEVLEKSTDIPNFVEINKVLSSLH